MEASDYAEITASNISEASYGESLCLSVKEHYKIINRNQLTKVDLPMLRAATSSIDCGISLMEEISDVEDDYESPFENRSAKEKISDFFTNLKKSYKKSHSKIQNKIFNLNFKVKNMKNKNQNTSKPTSSCNSITKSTTSSLPKLTKLSSSNIISTSRKVKVKTALRQTTSQISYKINSGKSYLAKKCISIGSTIKSKVRYNYYKLRNIIGDLFPKRKSKFILSFKRGSKEVHKTMNSEPINESMLFENEIMYDSIEYMSRNIEDDSAFNTETNKENIQDENIKIVDEIINNQEDNHQFIDNTKNLSLEISEKDQLPELNLIENHNYIKNNEHDATPTTINSFPRLGSVDSTTCTIQNDTLSASTIIDMEKLLQQIEVIYNEIIALKKTKVHNISKIKQINHNTNNKTYSEITDDEIFMAVKEITEIFKNKFENVDKKTFNHELSLLLIKQTLQYYQEKKNDLLSSKKPLQRSKDSEEILHESQKTRNFIIDTINTLKINENLHEIKLQANS